MSWSPRVGVAGPQLSSIRSVAKSPASGYKEPGNGIDGNGRFVQKEIQEQAIWFVVLTVGKVSRSVPAPALAAVPHCRNCLELRLGTAACAR